MIHGSTTSVRGGGVLGKSTNSFWEVDVASKVEVDSKKDHWKEAERGKELAGRNQYNPVARARLRGGEDVGGRRLAPLHWPKDSNGTVLAGDMEHWRGGEG